MQLKAPRNTFTYRQRNTLTPTLETLLYIGID